MVIPALAGLNFWTNEFNYIWFLWPTMGWGLSLSLHAASVFLFQKKWGEPWEDRKIKEFMQEDN